MMVQLGLGEKLGAGTWWKKWVAREDVCGRLYPALPCPVFLLSASRLSQGEQPLPHAPSAMTTKLSLLAPNGENQGLWTEMTLKPSIQINLAFLKLPMLGLFDIVQKVTGTVCAER